MRWMRRLALLAVPAVVAACGGSARQSDAQTAAPVARPAPRLYTPAPGKVLAAQAFGKQLHVIVHLTGTAAPGQQLSLRGRCGGIDCEGITFADSNGRWRTRMELYSPPRKHAVALLIAYADPQSGERPTTVTLKLRKTKAQPVPEAAPQSAPPKSAAPSTGGTSTGGTAAPSGANPYSGARDVIVIGDSLAVGMARPLKADLGDWPVSIDGRIGRPLAEGMQILAETPLPPGEEGAHTVFEFSMFTNDSPSNVTQLEQAVRYSISRLGAHGCAVWATIARPAQRGVSYNAANDRLEALANDPSLASQLIVVPWKQEVTAHPSWLGSDHVHATPEGYAARAKMYAEAAQACAA
jgi:hypothetical protein